MINSTQRWLILNVNGKLCRIEDDKICLASYLWQDFRASYNATNYKMQNVFLIPLYKGSRAVSSTDWTTL